MASLWKWIRAGTAACLWAFALAALLGALEAVSQLLRFGGWTSADGEAGLVRSIAPTAALYGWFALGVTALLFPGFFLFTRRRPAARRRAFAFSVALPLGALAGIYLGYLGHDHLLTDWWMRHESGWAPALQFVATVVTAVLLVRPLTVLAERLVLSPRRNLALPVVVLIVLTSLWPDWRQEGRLARCGADVPSPGDGPDVVLVTIDAWQTASIDLPPAAAALAAEGIRFDNAWSSGSWTLPGMGSLQTGLSAATLDLHRWRGLSPNVTTLAQAAHAAGWHTAAFATNPFLTGYYGFDRGFEVFEHSLDLEPLTPAGRSILAREAARLAESHLVLEDAAIVIRKTLRWLERAPDDRPLFLWVHLLDPHLPYRSHGEALRVDSPLLDAGGLGADRLLDVRAALPGLSQPERDAIVDLYHRELLRADAWTDQLFAALRARGRWDRTLVVLTSDHGEELFEHDGFEHGHSLLPEVARVPLIVKLPDSVGAGRRVAADRSLLDLAPSLCRLVGWELPGTVEGREDLWREDPLWTTPATPDVTSDLLYGEQRAAVRAWPFLGIGPDGGTVDWWDCSQTPALPLQEPPSGAAALLAARDSILALRADRAGVLWEGAEGETGPDAATRRQLRSLGY